MHDVLTVMDAVGSRRAVLFGYSEGGPMASLMAAMHPERVEALVLYGSYARRLRADDYPWGALRRIVRGTWNGWPSSGAGRPSSVPVRTGGWSAS
jgi:pimeloyl-ACP methyl ester carboxylesterase